MNGIGQKERLPLINRIIVPGMLVPIRRSGPCNLQLLFAYCHIVGAEIANLPLAPWKNAVCKCVSSAELEGNLLLRKHSAIRQYLIPKVGIWQVVTLGVDVGNKNKQQYQNQKFTHN